MLIKHQALALAAAALLAGCGGGSDGIESPQVAAASALRMRAQAVTPAAASTVAPEVAAEQLMDYAESVAAFKPYFPQHQGTLTFGPFRYRAYSSGVLLGVVVQADATYQLNHVYVMGGPFGNTPLDVGLLTNYITPTDPNTNPSGGNNGCADLSKADTQGTHIVEVFDYSGPLSGTQTVDTVVGGTVSFEGNQATETTIKTTGTNTVAGITTAVDTQGKAYAKRTGDAEMTHYGGLFSSSTSNVFGGVTSTTATTIKTVYSPPWVDKIYGLAIGESLTVAYASNTTTTTTITTSVPGVPPIVNTLPGTSNTNQTIKYVGRETVTVPAGTYNTCRFDYTGADGSSTQWIIVGNGLLAKSVSTVQGATQTIQATSITLNGQRI